MQRHVLQLLGDVALPSYHVLGKWGQRTNEIKPATSEKKKKKVEERGEKKEVHSATSQGEDLRVKLEDLLDVIVQVAL